MRILVVEHDSSLTAFLESEFAAERISGDVVASAEQAKAWLARRDYAVAVIDAELPRAEGFELLRHLRAQGAKGAIPILATGSQPALATQTLDLGADSFLLKPFGFSQLLGRVRALVRGDRPGEPVLRLDNLELRRGERHVTRAGRKIRLTPKEFALLEFLLANAGQHVTRSQIVQHVWHHNGELLTNIVDVYVNYLRKKVDVPFEPKLIHTVRGVGYRLEARNSSDGRAA